MISTSRITSFSDLETAPERAKFFLKREVNFQTRTLFGVHCGNELMGIAQVTDESGVYPGNVGIGYVEVFKKHQGKGYSTHLIRRIFEHSTSLHKGLRTGHFTTDGDSFLRHQIDRLAREEFPHVHVIYN